MTYSFSISINELSTCMVPSTSIHRRQVCKIPRLSILDDYIYTFIFCVISTGENVLAIYFNTASKPLCVITIQCILLLPGLNPGTIAIIIFSRASELVAA